MVLLLLLLLLLFCCDVERNGRISLSQKLGTISHNVNTRTDRWNAAEGEKPLPNTSPTAGCSLAWRLFPDRSRRRLAASDLSLRRFRIRSRKRLAASNLSLLSSRCPCSHQVPFWFTRWAFQILGLLPVMYCRASLILRPAAGAAALSPRISRHGLYDLYSSLSESPEELECDRLQACFSRWWISHIFLFGSSYRSRFRSVLRLWLVSVCFSVSHCDVDQPSRDPGSAPFHAQIQKCLLAFSICRARTTICSVLEPHSSVTSAPSLRSCSCRALLVCLHLKSSSSTHKPNRSRVAILRCTLLSQFSRASGRIVQVVPIPFHVLQIPAVEFVFVVQLLSHERVASIVLSTPMYHPATVHHLLCPVCHRDLSICADLHSLVC